VDQQPDWRIVRPWLELLERSLTHHHRMSEVPIHMMIARHAVGRKTPDILGSSIAMSSAGLTDPGGGKCKLQYEHTVMPLSLRSQALYERDWLWLGGLAGGSTNAAAFMRVFLGAFRILTLTVGLLVAPCAVHWLLHLSCLFASN
jgi:hypothetical protein